METWPSLGQSTTMIIVSVRKELPGRLSEPISRKLSVVLPVRAGRGAGATPAASGGGGAAAVGKRAARSTVGVGWTAVGPVGEEVAVGSDLSSVGTGAKYSDVGVACPAAGGWKAVGVGEALGAG